MTRALDSRPDLVALADPANPLLWVRGDRGCVGIGEVLRLRFRGPNRFAEAGAAWRELAAAARVTDPIVRPGSGLIALGTFAFSDESAVESVLVVPRRLIARDGDLAWVTDISLDGAPEALPIPEATPIGSLSADPGFLPGSFSEAAYRTAVATTTDRIDAGLVEKVVLARDLRGELAANSDLRRPLGRLAEDYLDCWTFAVDGMLGASPETLIRSTDGGVSARVLAGTSPRDSDASRDTASRDGLVGSDKNQQEHAFAVRSVTEALSPFISELSLSPVPFALKLPNVWHLATDLTARLTAGATAIELAGALHPTAAIAGTPTPVAIAEIAAQEPFDRGRYSGAVGWIGGSGDGEWAIALRCAQVEGGVGSEPRAITAYAGGGIVAGSDPATELAETHSKFRPVLDAFGA